MPDVKPKALAAAGEVYASQDRREQPTASDIEGTAEDLRDPIKTYINHPDAGLVERRKLKAAQDGWDECTKSWGRALVARCDEARREAEELGKQLAELETLRGPRDQGQKPLFEQLRGGRGDLVQELPGSGWSSVGYAGWGGPGGGAETDATAQGVRGDQ